MQKKKRILYTITLIFSLFLARASVVLAEESDMTTPPIASYEKICLKTEESVHHPSFAVYAAENNQQTLNPEKIFSLINDYRVKFGKTPFEKNETLCELARSREPELYGEIFVSHTIHAGIKNRNLPYRVVENMKYGHSEEDVFNWWLSSPLHRRSIENGYKYSCGTCRGKICIQLFSDFTPQ